MKKYICYYQSNREDTHQTVEAESPEDALRIFTESNPNAEFPEVTIEWGWRIKIFSNPNYGKPQKAVTEKVKESGSRQPTQTDSSSQQPPPIDNSTRQPITLTGSPRSSGWATLYRVCGGIAFVFGFIGTIAVAQKNEEAGFQLAVMAIALTLTCFLAAFLIDVLTDMRHYLKAIAEKK